MIKGMLRAPFLLKSFLALCSLALVMGCAGEGGGTIGGTGVKVDGPGGGGPSGPPAEEVPPARHALAGSYFPRNPRPGDEALVVGEDGKFRVVYQYQEDKNVAFLLLAKTTLTGEIGSDGRFTGEHQTVSASGVTQTGPVEGSLEVSGGRITMSGDIAESFNDVGFVRSYEGPAPTNDPELPPIDVSLAPLPYAGNFTTRTTINGTLRVEPNGRFAATWDNISQVTWEQDPAAGTTSFVGTIGSDGRSFRGFAYHTLPGYGVSRETVEGDFYFQVSGNITFSFGPAEVKGSNIFLYEPVRD